MAGPRSYKPQTGVRFPQLRQTPRAAVVRLSVRSEIAPLHGASPMGAPRAAHLRSWRLHFPRSKVVSRPLKPVTLVRFQLGERHGGRGVLECTPRCERGGAGSIPADHPQATTGCGSMAGHLARNQVHAGSIPAAQTRAAHWGAGMPCKQPAEGSIPSRSTTTALWTTWQCRRPLKAQDRVRLPAGSQRPIGLRAVRLPDGTQSRECCRMVGNRSRKPGWW